MTTGNWHLAHCVHLDRPLQGTVAHNPRSNMNNAVGYARPARLANTVVLGTDGIGGDMLEEFRIAYVRHREDDVTATPDLAWSWLENGRALVPETAEDRVRWSYEPVDPWHLAFTPGVQPVEVVVDGEVVLRDGRTDASRRPRGAGAGARAGGAALGQALEALGRPSRVGGVPARSLSPRAQAVQSEKASIMACTSAPRG